MERSFTNPQENKDNAEEKPEETGIVAPGQFSDSGLEGEWDTSDLRTPYFSLVAKTGSLSDSFTPGSFVFNKEIEVGDGKDPAFITVLDAKKYYIEDIEFDPDIQPRRFDRLEEARAEGFSTEWGAEKRVKSAASLIVLVPVPSEYATFMPPKEVRDAINGSDSAKKLKRKILGDDQGFARAMWIVQSSAYNTVGKAVATAIIGGHLKGGAWKGPWAITSELRTMKKNSWFVPLAKAAGLHPANVVEWIESEVKI